MGFVVGIGAWLCVLSVCVNGNHQWGGSPVLSLDPLRAALSSLASSRASSGAGGASSSAWSSAGTGGRHGPRISVLSRRRGSQRGVSPRNVIMVNPHRSQPGRGSAILGLLGGLSNRRIAARRSPTIFRQPVNTAGRLTPIRVITPHRPMLRGHSPIIHSIPVGAPISTAPQSNSGGGMLYVDGAQLGSIANVGQMIPPAPQGPFALDPNAVGAQIPVAGSSNKLTIKGQTPTGDLVISGPAGSITIGIDVLNGISRIRPAGGMFNTEFEELEVGEEPILNNNTSNALKLTSPTGQSLILKGKQTIIPSAPLTRASAMSSVGGGASSIILGGASSISGTSSASSAASSSASAGVGGMVASSSASASSNAGVVNSAASGGSGRGSGAAVNDGSIIVRSGTGGAERVVQLGQADGQPKTITLGGASGIQVGQGGNFQVPGNATIVVNG